MGKHSIKAKRNREKIDKKKVKKISKTISKLDVEVFKSDSQVQANRLLVARSYLELIKERRGVLPSLQDVANKSGLTLPTVHKHQRALISEIADNATLVDNLQIYKAPLLEAIFHNAIHTKCVRSQALACQIFDLLHIKQNETNNKQINTTFKIVSNENEKKIEGVG